MKVDMDISYINNTIQTLKEVNFKGCKTIPDIRDFLEKKVILVIGDNLIYTDKIKHISFTKLQ